jgi:hypothetical protein
VGLVDAASPFAPKRIRLHSSAVASQRLPRQWRDSRPHGYERSGKRLRLPSLALTLLAGTNHNDRPEGRPAFVTAMKEARTTSQDWVISGRPLLSGPGQAGLPEHFAEAVWLPNDPSQLSRRPDRRRLGLPAPMTELKLIHVGKSPFRQFVTGPVCHATILSHRFSPIIFASARADDQTFLIVISASERYQRRRSRGRPRSLTSVDERA